MFNHFTAGHIVLSSTFKYLKEGCLTLNFWNLLTAVTFKFLPWHILKYTLLEKKWATESIFGIKYPPKWWFFDKITKTPFFGSKFLWQANKNIWVKNAQTFGKSRKGPCLGTDFLFFSLISYFSNFWQKSAKNVFFLKKSWGALLFEVGYHPRKKIHVIRVVFQDQVMYAHTSFRGAKMCKIGKKGVFLVRLTNFGKDVMGKLRKIHAETRLGSIFMPEKYVFRVCFESPFTRMISSLKYKWPPREKIQILVLFSLSFEKFKTRWKNNNNNNKKNVPRAKYFLHDKSNNLDFPWLLFELFCLKNCQKTSKLKRKKSPI